MTERRSGGCLCGGVRFVLHGAPRDVIVCHCSLCRRSGTLAGAYVGIPDDLLVVVAAEALVRYVDANARERSFCGQCGSSLFWRNRADGEISVAAGALDDGTGLVTLRHIHVESAAPWEAMPAGAPHHPTGSSSPPR